MSFLLYCSITIHLYKPFCFLLFANESIVCFFTASEPDDKDFVLYELLKPPKDAAY